MNSKVNPASLKENLQVSVAVISHNDLYLLGYRNAKQHQGERYEFVGGKIESKENPLQALIREVTEEIGLNLQPELCQKMGEINHDYPEMSVCLHIFTVSITEEQFTFLKHSKTGAIEQPLVWVNKVDLLDNKYPLPEANAEILSWLRK